MGLYPGDIYSEVLIDHIKYYFVQNQILTS